MNPAEQPPATDIPGARSTAAGHAEAAAPSVAPSKALTLPARRLRGSPACLNCGTPLKGPFCYYCGQPDKNLVRFFPALVRDVLEDFMDLDSRVMRTLKPLLLHPGKLTRDYLDGRRFRYTPPMRLYIFSSMIFFVLAATLAGSAIDISSSNEGEGKTFQLGVNEDSVSEVEKKLQAAAATLEHSNQQADPAIEGSPDVSADHSPAEPAEAPLSGADESAAPDADAASGSGNTDEHSGWEDISFGDKPWHRETNPLIIPGMPAWVNDWVNDEIAESPQKEKEIEDNPNLIIDKMFDVLPVTVFILLPLVALLFKFWYLFAGKYYVEHLIHALHNHSFLFVVLILTLLVDSLASWVEPGEQGPLSTFSSWFTSILLLWMPIYLLISLKTVYRQGWFLTLTKFSLMGISYLVLLIFISGLTALVSFLLL